MSWNYTSDDEWFIVVMRHERHAYSTFHTCKITWSRDNFNPCDVEIIRHSEIEFSIISQNRVGASCWNHSLWKTRICSSYIANAMTADVLTMLGARASNNSVDLVVPDYYCLCTWNVKTISLDEYSYILRDFAWSKSVLVDPVYWTFGVITLDRLRKQELDTK